MHPRNDPFKFPFNHGFYKFVFCLIHIYISFSSIRWLFIFIRVLPICNWELYLLKNLFSVILNSRRASPGLMCYLPFIYFVNHFLDYIWHVPLRYVLNRATLIFLAGWQTKKKFKEEDRVLYSFFIRTFFITTERLRLTKILRTYWEHSSGWGSIKNVILLICILNDKHKIKVTKRKEAHRNT